MMRATINAIGRHFDGYTLEVERATGADGYEVRLYGWREGEGKKPLEALGISENSFSGGGDFMSVYIENPRAGRTPPAGEAEIEVRARGGNVVLDVAHRDRSDRAAFVLAPHHARTLARRVEAAADVLDPEPASRSVYADVRRPPEGEIVPAAGR